MSIYNIAVIPLLVFLYIVLLWEIFKTGGAGQSFATWILWVSLDVIALFTIGEKDGNTLVLILYVCGGTCITISLICTKQFKWTWFEWVILAMVCVCLYSWKKAGPTLATIFSTIAVVVSGFPQLKEFWNTPNWHAARIYWGFLVVNILYVLAGKDWSIEQRFYPICCVFLCLTLAIVASLKPRKATS